MCGIFGYIGPRSPRHEVLRGLRRLEYRGYDSAGIAERGDEGINVTRSRGRVEQLAEKLATTSGGATIAIGHTRWATHGEPSERNAHPHRDCHGRLAVVHNGIIENHRELRRALRERGHSFRSDTDTEVISHLLEEAYDGDLVASVRSVLKQLKGQLALCVVHDLHPGIVAARRGSPLVVGVGQGEYVCASDASAVLERTRDVIYLHDGDVASLAPDSMEIFGASGERVQRPLERLDWSASQIQRGRFPHFMRKEIDEQSQAVNDALRGRWSDDGERVHMPQLRRLLARGPIEQIVMVGCGTSHHAGAFGARVFEDLGVAPTRVEIGSEVKDHPSVFGPGALVVLVSQSGETADTLRCLERAKAAGARTLAVCNVVGSSLARAADAVVFTHAGPEIAVASTKAFTTQVVVLTLVALALSEAVHPDRSRGRGAYADDLKALGSRIQRTLAKAAEIESEARRHAHARAFIFLGRGTGLDVAREGALKLAEVSYTAALAHATGEIKHGPLALVDAEIVVPICAVGEAAAKHAELAASEVRARGGHVVLISTQESRGPWTHIELPATRTPLGYLNAAIACQLFAYFVADELGRDIDKPRNLAKSVTVG